MNHGTHRGSRRALRTAGVIAAVALSAGLTACGGDDADDSGTAAAGGTTAPAAAGKASGTIRFSALVTFKQGYDAMIEEFERANPDVEVEAQYTPITTYGSVLNTQVQSGNAPDVVSITAGRVYPPSILDLGAADRLVDQSSAPWAERIPPIMSDLVSVDDTPYGWPVSVLTTAYVYNKTLMKSMGIGVPRTFPDLVNACRTIRQKSPGVVPVAWGGASASSLAGAAVVFASADVYADDPEWNDKRAAGQTTFAATPGWRKAVSRIKDLNDAKCFSPGVAADTPDALVGNMAREKAVMFLSGDSQLAPLRKANPDLDLGMFPAPADTQEQTNLTLYPNDALAVTRGAKNAAAAQAFVDFLTEPENNSRLAERNTVVAPTDYERAAEDGPEVLSPDHREFAPYLDRTVVAGSAIWPSTEIAATMGEAIQGLLTGQRSVDDVLKAADGAWPKQPRQ